MIRLIAQALLFSLLLVVHAGARAEIVRDLYSAQVPVANQTSAALADAARDALAEVLLKVSGSADTLQNTTIATALTDARNHVLQYAYQRDPGPEGELSARFEFDSSYITGLVTAAGLPLWTANRPVVLVWMVIEDEDGRQFVNGDSAPELTAQLQAEFSRRGVPMQLPLFDLTDSTAITPDDVWYANTAILRAAATRYHAQEILGGRLQTGSGVQVTGDWTYLQGEARLERSATVPDARAFIRDGVSLVAETMTARYAVAPTEANAGGVSMTISGVATYADYAAVVSWLKSLELIERANVERIQGDTIELRLLAQADAGQLAALMELNERLVPVPAAASSGRLRYQWRK